MKLPHWLRGRRRKNSPNSGKPFQRGRHRKLGFEGLEGRWLLSGVTPLLVTTTSDAAMHSGVSLRDALATATADAEAGQQVMIMFDSSLSGQSIMLQQGTIEIGSNSQATPGSVTINGGNQITIDGSENGSTMFQIDGGMTVSLVGLTITNGVTSFYNSGAAIASSGNLSISGSTFSDNHSGAGSAGAIFTSSGSSLTIAGSTFIDNTAQYYGGAIYSYGALSISGSTFTDNEAVQNDGGAIYIAGDLNPATRTITATTFSDNTAGLDGGAVEAANPGLIVNISASQFTSNTAARNGGALANGESTMTITGSSFSSNSANAGGAIFDDWVTNITDCTITGNSATTNVNTTTSYGGGVYSLGFSVVITDSTISNNTAVTAGGGIDFTGGAIGTSAVNESTIANNSVTASGGTGGGVEVERGMTIYASTINNNTANNGGIGGGIYDAASLSLIDSTVAANSATSGGGVGVHQTSPLTASFDTISGNVATSGGGIYSDDASNSLTLLSTIVAGNSASSADPDVDAVLANSGSIASLNNLIGNGTGMSGITNGASGNLVGTSGSPINPQLGALSNNGGPTQTMALASTSVAINAGGALTSLGGAISATDTSFGVADVGAILDGVSGAIVIQIDGEQMLVTGANGGGTSTIFVVRGYNGTTATSHSSGATISLPYDQLGDARVGAPDIGAFEYQGGPAIGLGNGGQITYAAGSGPTLIAPLAAVTAGANGLATAKLTVSLGSAGGADVLTIATGGGVTLNGSQLLYNGTLVGNFVAGAGSSPLVVQFNGAATQAAVQAVVDNVAFYNTNASPTIFNRTATFTLTDSKAVSSAPQTETINFVDVPPQLTGISDQIVNYTAGSGPTLIATSAYVVAGSVGMANAKLTVTVGSAGSADSLTIVAGGGVTLNGGQLYYNGTLVGYFVAGTGSSPMTVQFNTSATQAAAQAVVRDVAFYNTSSSPSIYNRTVTFTLDDSEKETVNSPTETVHFVDNPPTIGNFGGTVTYTAGSGATLLASSATVTAGSLGMSDAKVTVTIGSAGGADVVTVVAGSGITISGSTLSYNGTAVATFSAGAGSSPLVVQFYASATVPAVQAVIDQVAFYNTNASPTIYDRTASFTLADSKGVAASPSTETIHFVASPPTIGNVNSSVNYFVGSGPTNVAGGATVTAGSNGLAGSKLTVSLGNAGSADMVTVVAGGGITVSGSQLLYNGTVIANFASGSGSTPLVVQFNSAATATAVQAVVEDVAYYNTNPSMSVYDRTVSFTLADNKGVAASPINETIHVETAPPA